MFVYQYTKIAYAMCDLNQNMKQKKQKKTEKKQKKNIAKQTLGNGHTVGFKSFMKLHHCFLCIPTFSRVFFFLSLFYLHQANICREIKGMHRKDSKS